MPQVSLPMARYWLVSLLFHLSPLVNFSLIFRSTSNKAPRSEKCTERYYQNARILSLRKPFIKSLKAMILQYDDTRSEVLPRRH